MPTLSKPKLEEGPSVWHAPSRGMLRDLRANKAIVLQHLGFYREHDRPEDFAGKFSKQVQAHEKAVLSEIAGALTSAAAISASLSRPVIIATLESVQKNPALIFKKRFPGAVLWIVAQSYQRADEKPGTYWPDIIGERPKKFPGRLKRPIAARVAAAASRALHSLRNGRKPGRPRNFANQELANRLGPLFRRYNPTAARRSIVSSRGDGDLYQIDGGPFLDFIKIVLKPLQAHLRGQRLPNVSASMVVKQALRLWTKSLPTLFRP